MKFGVRDWQYGRKWLKEPDALSFVLWRIRITTRMKRARGEGWCHLSELFGLRYLQCRHCVWAWPSGVVFQAAKFRHLCPWMLKGLQIWSIVVTSFGGKCNHEIMAKLFAVVKSRHDLNCWILPRWPEHNWKLSCPNLIWFTVISLPLQMGIALWMLYMQVKFAFVAGLGVIILLIPGRYDYLDILIWSIISKQTDFEHQLCTIVSCLRGVSLPVYNFVFPQQ